MGRPSTSPLRRPDSDDVSLHARLGSASSSAGAPAGSSSAFPDASRHSYLDADDDAPELLGDIDDLPPLYSDVIEADLAAENAAIAGPPEADAEAATPLMAGAGYTHPLDECPNFRFTQDARTPQPWRYCVMQEPSDPSERTKSFARAMSVWCAHPPRPYVQLRGTHSERHERDGKKETREVVDFDVKVELTPYLYTSTNAAASWRTCETAENYEKAYRGTVVRHRAPGFKARRHVDLEQGALRVGDDSLGLDAQPKLTVQEWCERFCNDPSPLRSFTLRRRMTGFDYAKVKTQMEMLVRRTNYHGHLRVSFPVDEVGVVCYSDHRFNQWRVTRWIQVLCALTLMFLFTWPYLFFRTKKYDVVTVDWPFSRLCGHKEYASLSEDQWYNLWARAITKGVLSKRQGTLDQEDLREAEGADPTFAPTNNAAVDGALGFVRAGISAMNQVNRQLGWGGDC